MQEDQCLVVVHRCLFFFLPCFYSGYEECMVPVSSSLARVLASGHLSSNFVISVALPGLLGFLWPGCESWPDDQRQHHVSVLSSLAEGLRSLLLLLDPR